MLQCILFQTVQLKTDFLHVGTTPLTNLPLTNVPWQGFGMLRPCWVNSRVVGPGGRTPLTLQRSTVFQPWRFHLQGLHRLRSPPLLAKGQIQGDGRIVHQILVRRKKSKDGPKVKREPQHFWQLFSAFFWMKTAKDAQGCACDFRCI